MNYIKVNIRILNNFNQLDIILLKIILLNLSVKYKYKPLNFLTMIIFPIIYQIKLSLKIFNEKIKKFINYLFIYN